MALNFPNQKHSVYSHMLKQHDDPVLHFDGSSIQVVEESKFLGIIFDRKLSLIPPY